MKTLSIFVNDNEVHHYDCDGYLSDEQLAFLDRMDQDMDRGFKIQGRLIEQPDAQQRARFVALNLIRALRQENPAGVTVSCAYLCQRLPRLSEVHVRDRDGGHAVEFINGH